MSLLVQDVASNNVLIPIAARGDIQSQPYYLLKPNRLYAIQCIVEQSRPQSQVVWFNRTAPLQVEQIELDSNEANEFELPATELAGFAVVPSQRQHRLSSFVKHTPLADGSYR